LLDLAVDLLVYERAFFCASAHSLSNRSDVHRLRPLLVLAHLAAAEDQLVAVLLGVPGDAALGGDAGLADRVSSAVGAALATAQRVVDGVHRLGPGVGADAAVTVAAGLADGHVDPVEVAELADRRAAGAA